MFKIAKLENVNNENVTINCYTLQKCSSELGKKVKDETFKTLTFDVSGDDYSLSFELNCKLEKLLEILENIKPGVDYENTKTLIDDHYLVFKEQNHIILLKICLWW